MDFARHQEAAFDKWVRASEVYDFIELRELMVLEQFKQSLPRAIEVHLSDLRVSTVTKAAEATDNYVLIHQDSWRDKFAEPQRRSGELQRRKVDRNHGSCHPPAQYSKGGHFHKYSVSLGDIIGYHCGMPGHIRSVALLLLTS